MKRIMNLGYVILVCIGITFSASPCHAFGFPTFDIAEVGGTIKGVVTDVQSLVSTVQSTISQSKLLQSIGDAVGAVSKFRDENAEKMMICGDSVGAGNVRVNKINEFSVNLAGDYNSLILNYKDTTGMISKVTEIIQDKHINIASLICERNAKGEVASMCICLDGEIDDSLVENIKNIPDIYFVRRVNKLES